MKKYVSLIMALILVFALAACNDGNPPDETTPHDAQTNETEANETETDEVETDVTSLEVVEAISSRVQYHDGYIGGLNSDKMYISSVNHLPILKFDTLDQLNRFKEYYGEQYNLDFGYDEILPFNEATADYDEEFFSENTLLLVNLISGSGSYRYGVESVYCKDQYCTVYVEQINDPYCGTCDMAEWFITVAVKKDALADVTEFDAILN